VRKAVLSKLSWIRKQQAKFVGQERRLLPPEYVSGESHYFQGTCYRLNVVEHLGRSRVTMSDRATLDLYIRPDSERDQRERVLLNWYRQQLNEQVPALLAKWEAIMGVQSAEWHIKQMKTRWGTCNPRASRIWLNLELAKKPVDCLEYVIVHELVHLLARKHDAKFKGYMDKFLPQWRLLREELNRTSVGHMVQE
jgi:predicted metal-dependent hydrolase